MDMSEEVIPVSEKEALIRTAVYFAELKRRELASRKAYDAWKRECDMPITMTSSVRLRTWKLKRNRFHPV
jgi:hypothetical protein